jgi:MoaA/NifB/PqqE/SkfB family radical SAM enzyme
MIGCENNNGFEQNLELQKQEINEKKVTLKSLPSRLAILLGNKCNIRCKMCGNRGLFTRMGLRNTTRLNNTALNDIFSYFPVQKFITISGGEPLAYKELRTIVDKAKNYPKLKLNIMTNGNLINDYWASEFCTSNFKSVLISLDAATQKTYKSIRSRGDLKHILNAINSINEQKNGHGPDIATSFVVMRRNFHEILDFIELAHKYNISKVSYNTISKQRLLFYSMENVMQNEGSCKKLLDISEKINELASDYKIEVLNKLPSNVFYYKPSLFYDYYNFRENDLNYDEKFECPIFWKRLVVTPNYYTICFNSIQKHWDPIYLNSNNNGHAKKIEDIWNCKKIVEAREFIVNRQFEKVCKLTCPKFFEYRTKGVI